LYLDYFACYRENKFIQQFKETGFFTYADVCAYTYGEISALSVFQTDTGEGFLISHARKKNN
jgi:hypothetical protein